MTAPTLVSIAVTPVGPVATTGNTQQFIATGTYTDQSTADLTNQVTWASSNTSVATISNAPGSQGLASALSPGTTAITATLGGVGSAPDTLTVTASIPVLNPVAVKDNGQGGYYEYGVWSTATGGYNGSNRVAGPGTSTTNAQWALKVPPGTYDFYATWTSSASNSTTAPFTLIDGFTRLGMVSVNQQLAPADAQYGGFLWSKLGTFHGHEGDRGVRARGDERRERRGRRRTPGADQTASPSFTL